MLLSGCAALEALKMLGGGTSSKGHGNDNTVLVGSDQSNGLSTGGKTDVDAENVGGDVTGRDKTNVVGANSVYMVNFPISIVYVLLFLMLAGWLLPTPTKMFKWIASKCSRK